MKREEHLPVGRHPLTISCLGMIYEYPSISGSRERDVTGNVMTKHVTRYLRLVPGDCPMPKPAAPGSILDDDFNSSSREDFQPCQGWCDG